MIGFVLLVTLWLLQLLAACMALLLPQSCGVCTGAGRPCQLAMAAAEPTSVVLLIF
jgi:hypothetical protein